MTGGQEKNFSTLGPKLSDNRAQQYYGDKTLQICVEESDYLKVMGGLGGWWHMKFLCPNSPFGFDF